MIAALSPDADEATNLAATQKALGDIPGLARAYESWAKRTKVPGSASYARANTAFAKQAYKTAESELTQALEADPLNPRYNYLRAQARYSQSKLEEARVDIENAIAYAPEESVYYLSLGKISTGPSTTHCVETLTGCQEALRHEERRSAISRRAIDSLPCPLDSAFKLLSPLAARSREH